MAVHPITGDSSSLVELREISILFAEDDTSVRTHISRMLTPVCGELYTAENGRVALDLFRKKMPDLVLTDITMPAMTGLDLARQIKLERPAVPVIIISSHDDSEHLLHQNYAFDSYSDNIDRGLMPILL